MTKFLLVAGARPNFMKIAPLWRELQARRDLCRTLLVHTGQHYDKNMSQVFFDDLGLPRPDLYLGVGSGSHAVQTAKIMVEFEKVCQEHVPNCVVVVGDVNSTLACAITAKKLWIPVAHVEAGLRSRNWRMPEEVNRIVTDALADYLFTPSRDADQNLLREGAPPAGIHFVGNIMIDSLISARERAKDRAVASRFGLAPQGYGLATLHRPHNVDDEATLVRLLKTIVELDYPVIFPVHPRTRKMLDACWSGVARESARERLQMADPLPYFDFVNLMLNARFVLTDSGGIQEETTYLGIPCLTLRPQTERPVTVTEGTNELVTADSLPAAAKRILANQWKRGKIPELWDGKTAGRIADVLLAGVRPPRS
jgi:UDP-N-acetylglucosamine 2-epimerase (non-hydrolysing)